MTSVTQKLANFYSIAGAYQLLVAVYHNEFVIYAQVTKATAEHLEKVLEGYRPPFKRKEPRALSADGLTWCWVYQRNESKAVRTRWLPTVLAHLYEAVKEVAPHLLGQNQSINYKDNQQLDDYTVEAFVRQLT